MPKQYKTREWWPGGKVSDRCALAWHWLHEPEDAMPAVALNLPKAHGWQWLLEGAPTTAE
jgi:hypothetical protein